MRSFRNFVFPRSAPSKNRRAQPRRSDRIYEPLSKSIDTIRVIHLWPYKNSEEPGKTQMIQCSLKHVTFEQLPEYEALSYEWGNATKLRTIRIGKEEVRIRENLWVALDELRKETREVRVLWIDALCINQKDSEERSGQVRLMAFIYSRAQKVHVWLGLSDAPRSGLRCANTLCLRELEWLCGRGYWERLWIIQEIGLAKELSIVYADPRNLWRCPWDDFVELLRHSQTVMNEPYFSKAKLPLKLAQQRRDKHVSRLERLLVDFNGAKCKEPRDKIYGLLGLASDCPVNKIKVDYEKPMFELFEEIVRVFYHHTTPSEPGFPQSIDRSMRLAQFSQMIQKSLVMNASSTNLRRVRTISNSTMCARGIIVGSVLHVGPLCSGIISTYLEYQLWTASFAEHYRQEQDLEKVREMFETYYDKKLLKWSKDSLTAKYRKIDSNITWGKLCSEFWLDGFRKSTQNQQFPIPTTSTTSGNGPSTSSGPHVFLADNFMMGLAPPGTRQSDLICRFWKTTVAAVMRPVEGTDRYKIIGRAHVESYEHWEHEKPYFESNSSRLDGAVMNVHMDIETIQALTW
jgi:hypothetical protein